MVQRTIQIKKKPKPPPKPKRHIKINKPAAAKVEANKHVIVKKKPKPAPTPAKPINANNPIRVASHRNSATKPRRRKRKSNPWAKLIPIGVVAFVVIILTVIISKHTRKPTKLRISNDYIEEDITLDTQLLARVALAEAKEWAKENPNKYDKIIALYQDVIDKYPEELSAKIAARNLKSWQNEKQKEVDSCMVDLEQRCKTLVAEKEYSEAISAYINYDGLYAIETEARRKSKADEIEVLVQNIQAESEVTILDRALTILLTSGVEDANTFVTLYSHKTKTLQLNKEWQQLVDILDLAVRVPEFILESFEHQIGQTITVTLINGKMSGQVYGVKDGKVQLSNKKGNANVIKEFSPDNLSAKEKLQRLKNNLDGIALITVIEAAKKQNFVTAQKFLQLTPSPLKESIAEKLNQAQISKESDIVSLQLSQTLHLAKIKVTPADNFGAALQKLKTTNLSTGMKLLLYSQAKDIQRSSRDLPWYKEDTNHDLISYILDFKTDDNGYDSDNEQANAPEIPVDDTTTDWRKEIDF